MEDTKSTNYPIVTLLLGGGGVKTLSRQQKGYRTIHRDNYI